MEHGRRWEGWALTSRLTVFLVLLVALVLALFSVGEPGLRAGIRVTARSSYALFLAAFVASSCAALFPSRATKWLLRNRRAVGVSFAVSMGLHGALIVALALLHRSSFLATVQPIGLIGGGIGYVFIALMTATSFDRGAALIGRSTWKVLHKTGMYYLWIVFTFSYVGRLRSPAYAGMVGLLFLALGLRLAAAIRRLRLRRGRLVGPRAKGR